METFSPHWSTHLSPVLTSRMKKKSVKKGTKCREPQQSRAQVRPWVPVPTFPWSRAVVPMLQSPEEPARERLRIFNRLFCLFRQIKSSPENTSAATQEVAQDQDGELHYASIQLRLVQNDVLYSNITAVQLQGQTEEDKDDHTVYSNVMPAACQRWAETDSIVSIIPPQTEMGRFENSSSSLFPLAGVKKTKMTCTA